jgi:hypothetical protein
MSASETRSSFAGQSSKHTFREINLRKSQCRVQFNPGISTATAYASIVIMSEGKKLSANQSLIQFHLISSRNGWG